MASLATYQTDFQYTKHKCYLFKDIGSGPQMNDDPGNTISLTLNITYSGNGLDISGVCCLQSQCQNSLQQDPNQGLI